MAPGPGTTGADGAAAAQQGYVREVVAAAGAAQTIPAPSVKDEVDVLTLTAACTIALPIPSAGKRFRLVLIQGGAGSYTVTWTPPTGGAIKWVGAAAPTLATAVGKTDQVEFFSWDGVNWIGQPILNAS